MKIQGLVPLEHLLKEIGSEVGTRYPYADHYLVDFNRMYTKQLLTLYRNITLFDDWHNNLRKPKIDKERVAYLKKINNFLGTDFKIEDEMKPETVRLIKFFENKERYAIELKKILDKRENIPNKKQKKKVRRLKAQGKYVID